MNDPDTDPEQSFSPGHEFTESLLTKGYGFIPCLLSSAECERLTELYDQPEAFRKRILMARHGFGRGEYQYFDYPLPVLVQGLRSGIYQSLQPLANRWHKALGLSAIFPPSHAEYREQCVASGQTRATPLLLRYGPGDFNCLHQDLYGDHVFPFQVIVQLSRPGTDFAGGELVMTEQRPRMQSRPMVIPLQQGDGVVIATRYRPAQGSRGTYRVNLRHGVSEVTRGIRHTLGIIFHDAQ